MPVLEQVLEHYPQKAKLVLKNFPLRSHSYANKAAQAALAAGDQGKYWEFHDLLFENYNRLNDKKIEEIRKKLGLDEAAFRKQMQAPEARKKIRQDLQDGQQAGVRGTPTVFVNGRLIRDKTAAGIKAAVANELARMAKK